MSDDLTPALTDQDLIPTTILTGFLGSGKTTLLNRILTEHHGMKIAVIENEYGEAGIDSELLVQSEEQVVTMNNGCLCCTVRGDLLNIMVDLAEKRDRGELDFDRVIIETTGLADPTPIAQTFFLEEAICSRYRLDGVVTLVDAKHGHKQLDEHTEAQAQVGFADRIYLSKLDIAEPGTEASLRDRLSTINVRAPIDTVHFGEADLKAVLAVNGFNLDAVLDLSPDFLGKESKAHHHDHECDHAECGHDHHYHQVDHNDEVGSFVLKTNIPIDMERFDQFLTELVERYSDDLMRYKGIVNFDGYDIRYVFQGVHDVAGCSEGKPWEDGTVRETVVVFIGRNLPKDIITQEFDRTLIH